MDSGPKQVSVRNIDILLTRETLTGNYAKLKNQILALILRGFIPTSRNEQFQEFKIILDENGFNPNQAGNYALFLSECFEIIRDEIDALVKGDAIPQVDITSRYNALVERFFTQ